ncbi:MAG: leucine zipper domain-containing protein [Beijerinckiaceae bacterium]
MNVHKNARLTPRGRERIVRQVTSGQTAAAVAEVAGVCPRTVRKWVDRYRREGLAGLQDRSSRPHRLRQPTPHVVVEEIERLRRQRTKTDPASSANLNTTLKNRRHNMPRDKRSPASAATESRADRVPTTGDQ